MKIVVCIKQVPDTTEIKIDPVKNTLIRTGVPSIMNPFDKNALETGLSLKDRYGGKVTVISMGPPQAKAVLREALAMGADEAYLVTDRAFGGSDTYATSYILSQAIKKLRLRCHPGRQAGNRRRYRPDRTEYRRASGRNSSDLRSELKG